MGILRTREEYLPVTCAILKAEDREAFFSAIKKDHQGRPEHIARLCETTVDTINDWISGKANIPYHTLQLLAHHYQVTIPPIGELRREYLAVSQTASRHETPTPPPPSKKTRADARLPREDRPRKGRGKNKQRREEKPAAERRDPPKPESKQKESRDRRGRGVRPPQPQQQQQQQQQRNKPPQGPRVPEPSEELAYWVGITLVAGRREGSDLIMTADRRVGQNFAGTWAGLTRDLFGARPALAMLDHGKAQEARLPVAGFEEFLDRLDLKEGKPFHDAGVPRWAWSNPAWKTACLKGLFDGGAFFQRSPALVLEGLPERLAKAVQKMLSAFELETVAGPTGALQLAGVETLDTYFEKVGTGNMKLRDQYRAYRNPRGGRAPREEGGARALEGAPAQAQAGDEESAEGQRVLAEEVEVADDEAELQQEEAAKASLASERAPDQDTLEAAADAAAAAKAHASSQPSRFGDPPPQPKGKGQDKHRGGRRKTLFRGRPRR